MPGEVIFQKASVLCYRLFDVAEEIDLEKAQALINRPADERGPSLGADSRRLKLASREGNEYLLLPSPPLSVELGARSVPLAGSAVAAECTARLFDYGAISILLRVPIPPGTTMEALIPLADELYDSEAIDRLGAEASAHLCAALAETMTDPHRWVQSESYSVIFAQALAGDPKADELIGRPELPRLLLGEVGARPLSARERLDVIEHWFSYTEQDLVVVDWNAAFVYEPSGTSDIPDLLEIVNAQLLELRYYDDVLDGELRRTHEAIGSRRRTWRSLFWSPYRLLARRLLATLMDLSEFVERVENSLKIVGDFYLAKVYEAAIKQLRIGPWQASVTRKQRLLAQTYELLKGEVDTDRALTLETTIVLLIVMELLFATLSVWH